MKKRALALCIAAGLVLPSAVVARDWYTLALDKGDGATLSCPGTLTVRNGPLPVDPSKPRLLFVSCN